jgi:hypothetical protein
MPPPLEAVSVVPPPQSIPTMLPVATTTTTTTTPTTPTTTVPDPNYPEPVKVKKTKKERGPVKKKQKRDKNAPKRPTSNYLMFQTEQRMEIKKQGLQFGPTEIIKEIAKRWRALPEEQKHKWDRQVQSDKIRFQNEMKTYVPPEGAFLFHNNLLLLDTIFYMLTFY